MFCESLIRAGGGTLNCAVGPENGPPLLMLHGVCRCWQDFISVTPALAARWQLHLFDHRGHGSSPRRECYLVTDYVDDLAHVVGSFPDPVVLYGHSLGAMVAAAVAGRLPDKVRAIVLEDPPFHTMGDRIGETTFLELFAALRSIHDRLTAPPHDETEPARITRLTAELSQARVGGQRLGDLRELPLLRFTVRCLSAMDPAVLDPILQRRWLTGYDPPEVAASVRCPVLLFQADSAVGGMLSADDAAMFCRLAPQTLLVPAPGRGHLIHNTSADFMLRYLVPFLESV